MVVNVVERPPTNVVTVDVIVVQSEVSVVREDVIGIGVVIVADDEGLTGAIGRVDTDVEVGVLGGMSVCIININETIVLS